MSTSDRKLARVAFQGEPGAFSEAAAIQLLGGAITTVPRATFEAAFMAITEGAADFLLAPVENSLAGSVVRVYDLLLEKDLFIVKETILRIEHQLIGCPGATLANLRSVASHPMALAQCACEFLCDGTLTDRGLATTALGGPVPAFVWLRRGLREGLRAAGEVVTTGSIIGATPVSKGQRWTNRLHGSVSSSVEVTFT